MRRRRALAGSVLAFAGCALAWSHVSSANETLHTVATRDGVSVSYVLVQQGETPRIALVSFVGSQGALNLRERAGKPGFGFGPRANFLVRARSEFVDDAIAEAIVDAPSDHLPQGMDDSFRLGAAHATDMRAVIADVKATTHAAKVYLIGTSRGSISAAALGVALGDSLDGIVLSSMVTNAARDGSPGLSTFDFLRIKVPVLLVHHADDACRMSPYRNAEKLGSRYTLVTVSGGAPPQSDACDALSPHGYFGVEHETVGAIRAWLEGRDPPRRVKPAAAAQSRAFEPHMMTVAVRTSAPALPRE